MSSDLQKKINRVESILGNKVEQHGSFLTLRMDSISFPNDQHEISSKYVPQLNHLIRALQEFPDESFIIRYVDYAFDSLAYNQNLASRRAESIHAFIKSHRI